MQSSLAFSKCLAKDRENKIDIHRKHKDVSIGCLLHRGCSNVAPQSKKLLLITLLGMRPVTI